MWLDFEGFILLRQMSVCLSVCPIAFLCVTTRKPFGRFFEMKTAIGVTSIYLHLLAHSNFG